MWATKKRALIVSGLILCVALLGNGLQLIKPPDALVATGWRLPVTVGDFVAALSNVWRGYVPIPKPFPHYWHIWRGSGSIPQSTPYLEKLVWGSNFLLDREPTDLTLGVMLSLGLVAASTWTLRRSPMAVTWYLSGTCLMLLFQSVFALSALRHFGLYFILYLACLWCRSTRAAAHEPRPAVAENLSARLEHFFLSSLLALQVVAGVYVWIIHFQPPFSGSKQAADFIRRNGYANLLIVGSPEANVSPVTAYLNRPIYYPDSARFGTFTRETSASRDLPIQEVMSRVAQLARAEHADVLFLYAGFFADDRDKPLTDAWLHPDGRLSPLPEPPVKSYAQMSLLAEFRAIVDESYSLYIVRDVHEN